MKFTRTEITFTFLALVAIVTINAWWRVRVMGVQEQIREAEAAARHADSGITNDAGNNP
jgi:hypothetical protein